MAFNGSGTFARLHSWVSDRAAGIKIKADRADAEDDGFAAGLSNCICRDGQSTISADIPFNNKKITGLGDATGDTHALNRQTADGRYVRNPADLTEELSIASDDKFPFGDTSASGANRQAPFSKLRDLLGFPTGTKMLFVQSTAPVGWTKDTTHDNKALRIVSGAASSGGLTPFTTVFGARSIAQANIPNYNLNISGLTITGSQGFIHAIIQNNSAAGGSVVNAATTTSTNILGSSFDVGGTLPSGGSGTAMDFSVQYVDSIICTKD